MDGVNVLFTTPTPYQPGSVAVFLNGQLKRADFTDGWLETTPSTGLITLLQAPLPAAFGNPDDVVQVFYLDTSEVLPETEVSPMRGMLVASGELFSKLQETQQLVGIIEC